MGANVQTRSWISGYFDRLVANTLTQKAAVALKGVIEFANYAAGRYALRTEAGGYTIFQLPVSVVLAIDDTVTGDLEAVAAQSYRIGGVGDLNVFVEKAGLTQPAAEACVGYAEHQRMMRENA